MSLARTMVLGGDRDISTAGIPRTFPMNVVEFGMFTSVTFQLYVAAATGGPSAWSVVPRFQWALEHQTGDMFAAAPTYRDFTAAEITQYVVGGQDWTPITEATTTALRGQQRTLTNPPSLVRVVLTPTYTGGSSPKNLCTMLAVCR